MNRSTTEKLTFLAIAPAVLAAALGGCVSQQEIEHTNALLNETVARSMVACPQMEKDLRSALRETSTGTLEKINAAKASVCIDPRLSSLSYGFMNSVPYAGYYNDGKNIVITLKPSTDPYERPGQTFAPKTNARALHLLFKEADLSKPVMFAEKHPDACSKRACDTVVWRDAGTFKNVADRNPALNLLAAPK